MVRTALFALTILTMGVAPASAETDTIVERAIAGFIVPAYEQFTKEAETQSAVNQRLCLETNSAQLDAARDQFSKLVSAWSRVEIIRFGPVIHDNRLERILFWPDRKSTGLKQVQSALVRRDEGSIELASLRKKSVAMQGLGALEFVLFGTGSDVLLSDVGDFRCKYAQTISQAIAKTGAEIVADWKDTGGIVTHLIDPRPEYSDYRNEDEVMQEILAIWAHGAELVRDTRIKPFYSEKIVASKYRSALYWRSNQTMPSIHANIVGMRDLFELSGMVDSLSKDTAWLADSFLFELENFERVSGQLKLPMSTLVGDETARSEIEYLLLLSDSLSHIVTEEIAVELGLSVGFSSLDGD